MSTEPCLFSHARPGKPPSKNMHGFLALPGEIRNQIYEYYFRPGFRCEIAAKGRHFDYPRPRVVKLWSGVEHTNIHFLKKDASMEHKNPVTIRISRPLGKYSIVRGLQTDWLASLFALNLVCKQVYTETLAFLYYKTTFVFDAPRRINNFLSVVSKLKTEMIAKLHLHIVTYGPPKKPEYNTWQVRHTESWVRACKAASKNFQGLQELVIWMQINHNPLRFSLRESWVAPLLHFRRSNHRSTNFNPSTARRNNLDIVKIHILTRWSKNPPLAFNGNAELAEASIDLHHLFGQAIALAVLGAKEDEAMNNFNTAWKVTYREWQYHLGFAKINW